MSHQFAKPENALKRAQELIDVGQEQVALNALHDLLTSKRHRVWQQTLEDIMKKYLDLCVKLKKNRLAKDGLIQYRMMYQSSYSHSLEEVIKYFMDLSEKAAEDAGKLAQNLTLDTDDLEGEDMTPEGLLMEAFCGEEKSRTERELVTPCLKFLWDAYRTVLEVLRNNSKLEGLYQNAALRAFAFCRKYQRLQEFRRLCDMIRSHFQNLSRHPNQKDAVNLSNPDTVQLMLETRFQQLNTAVEMDLWQEAFRTVEDIHTLITLSKTVMKPPMMAQYLQKLTRIFWVGKNYLFHAWTWYKLYVLTKSMKKKVKDEELQIMSSNVLLAALSVAQTEQKEGILDLEVSDAEKESKLRMASLLGFTAGFPKLDTLFAEIENKSVLSQVLPELAGLHHVLLEEFHPLDLCEQIKPTLDFLKEHPSLNQYVEPIQRLALLRMLQQLSQAYSVIKISEVHSKCYFSSVLEVEKFVVDMVRQGELKARIDHQTGCLHFEQDAQQANRLREHLDSLTKNLDVATKMIRGLSPDEPLPEEKKAHDDMKHRVFTLVVKNFQSEQSRMNERKAVIEQRKKIHEQHVREYEVAERERTAIETKRRADEEAKRQALEAEAREEERVKREKMEMETEELVQMVAEMDRKKGGKATYQEIYEQVTDKNLDKQKVLRAKEEQQQKETTNFQNRIVAATRKLDHFVRASREAEAPLIRAHAEAIQAKEKEAWEKNQHELVAKARKELEDAKQSLEHYKSLGILDEYVKIREAFNADKRALFETNKTKHLEDLERRRVERRELRQRQAEAEQVRQARQRQEKEMQIAALKKTEEERVQRDVDRVAKERARAMGDMGDGPEVPHPSETEPWRRGPPTAAAPATSGAYVPPGRGMGDRDRGFGDRDRGFGDRDRGFGDRDRGFGDRDRGF
eukprot:Rmarinus@m.16385